MAADVVLMHGHATTYESIDTGDDARRGGRSR